MMSPRARTSQGHGPRSSMGIRLGAWAVPLVVLLGCKGVISDKGGGNGTGGGGTTQTVADLCKQEGPGLHVGRTLLRRLSRPQFNNTVRDLLGITDNPAAALSPDERIGPFTSNGIAPITDLIVQQHGEVAARVAAEAAPNMGRISPCDLTADSTDTCARQFITSFGLRAYRRPLLPAEVDQYAALFTMGRGTANDVSHGFQLLLQAFLQNPFFLYHADVGASGVPSATPVALTPYELAARLSYFLWNTLPDDQLFARAADQTLTDPGVLSTQVDRMLSDPRAGDAIPSFHMQWLGIDDMSSVDKDTTLFPQFNAALVTAMQGETAAFADYVVRSGDGLLATIFTAPFSFPQGPLFALYGMTQPAGFKAGDRVTLPTGQRAGILTQSAFLATQAHADQTSPVHRGLAVRQNILCQTIPPPPPTVKAVPPAVTSDTTQRQRFAVHESNPNCNGCHQMMDPIGLGFENYDAIGAYRTTENGAPIDASGEIVNAAADTAGTFDGVVDLGQKLAASRQVSDCVADQWFRFALGRMESNDDACAMAAIQAGFASSGGNIRQLLKQIVLSDAFTHVRAVGGTSN